MYRHCNWPNHFPVPTEPGALQTLRDYLDIWTMGAETGQRYYEIHHDLVTYGIYVVTTYEPDNRRTSQIAYEEWLSSIADPDPIG